MIAELKGAKLFVKRGDNEFSTGMLGHIKMLKDKTTGEERLGMCLDRGLARAWNEILKFACPSVPPGAGLESIHDSSLAARCAVLVRRGPGHLAHHT